MTDERSDQLEEIAHGAMRGAIGAMAMTGMRLFASDVGLIDQTPPQAIAKQRRVRGLLRQVPRKRRRAAVEFAHWSYGAQGGAVFGALPDGVRRQHWFGPLYGVALWLSWEIGLAPFLGIARRHRPEGRERAVLIADHLLYGFVLSEMRRRPQD